MKRVIKEQERIENQKIIILEILSQDFVYNYFSLIQNLIIKKDKDAIKHFSLFISWMNEILEKSILKEISINEELNLVEKYLKFEELRFGTKYYFNFNKCINSEKIRFSPFKLLYKTVMLLNQIRFNNDKKNVLEIEIQDSLGGKFIVKKFR
ncbi:MAG: histidine kinase [bacterium]